MNLPNHPTNERLEASKKDTEEKLEQSEHALANGLVLVIRDVNMLTKDVKIVNDNVSRLYKVVVGDPELRSEGLIEKNEASKKRHIETLDKVALMDKEMGMRIDELKNKLDIEITKLKTAGALVVPGMVVFWEMAKHFIFKN